MTDPAKALADALRKCRANHGMEFSAGLMTEVCDVLAAYDAAPKAENEMVDTPLGKLPKELLDKEKDENDALVKAERLLKSHGYTVYFDRGGKAENVDLVERLRDMISTADAMQHVMSGTFPDSAAAKAWKSVHGLLIEATDALSRAQQPDSDDMLTPEKAWTDLCNKDDRTSPEDYPDHCLITKEELDWYMRHAIAPQPDTVTDEMVEAAKIELLAHGEFGSTDGANRRNAEAAARAALTTALAVRAKP